MERPPIENEETHGLPWPWARPSMGVSASTEWDTPLIEFHDAREKLNGSTRSFVPPASLSEGTGDSSSGCVR